MVEIARRVKITSQPQYLHQLVFHPLRTGLTKSVEHQILSLKEVFKAPRHTPLALSVVKTIKASALQERKGVLYMVSVVTG